MKLIEKYTDKSYIEFRDRRSKVVLEDKKGGRVSYQGINKEEKELIAYRIDGGIMKDGTGLKCDYGLYTVSSDVLRLIELKGSDLGKAIKQIKHTLRYLLGDSILGVNVIHGRMVLSKARTPDLYSSEEKELIKILKQHNGNLLKATRVLKEGID
ncbi:hypothetical protein [Limibacterium fermenti]|jgi:hypothetical protein|uniref:hypothetical protein n=1 Tax=Limibacterium fermenti TaxID=3229863 RepID=UPI003A79F6DC